MNTPTYLDSIENHLKAIDMCIDNGMRMPALVLVYTGIDMVATLNRSINSNYVERSDFINWAEEYILNNGNIGCSATDLYAARCSVVHSYISKSRLSDQGKAKQIVYAWGSSNEQSLQEIISQTSLKNTVIVVHISELISAYRKGVKIWAKKLLNNTEIRKTVEKRSMLMFKDQEDHLTR